MLLFTFITYFQKAQICRKEIQNTISIEETLDDRKVLYLYPGISNTSECFPEFTEPLTKLCVLNVDKLNLNIICLKI